MWILNQDRTKLKNTHNLEIGFSITRKDNAVIVSFMTHCIGRYYTDAEAKEALSKLAAALTAEEEVFEMPKSFNQETFDRKHDARTRRKGGS